MNARPRLYRVWMEPTTYASVTADSAREAVRLAREAYRGLCRFRAAARPPVRVEVMA